MGTMIANGTDVVSFLKEQHQQVKAQFDAVLNASGDQRSQAFLKLKQMLTVHEAAEEEIVHPAAKRILPNGTQIVAAREKEEAEAKQVLAKLQALDASSPEFEQQLRTFQTNVLAHAESEETTELSKLQSALDQSKLANMTKQVQQVEADAAGSQRVPFMTNAQFKSL